MLLAPCSWALAALLTTAPDPVQTATASDDSRIEWLVLPILKYNDDTSLAYGLHFPIASKDAKDGHNRWFLELKLVHSLKNRHEHFFYFDLPDIFGVRFTLRADVLYVDTGNYFGRANSAHLEHPEDVRFRYQLLEPRVQTLVSDKFEGDFFWGAGLSFNYTRPRFAADSLLAERRPLGVEGGHGLIGLFTLGYDSRDNEVAPTRGLFLEGYVKAATRPLGSSFSFQAFGLVGQVYQTLLPNLVFAQRLQFEDLGGAVPFYEENRIGGRTSVFGLGGVFSQRGFLEARFTGRSKLLSNSELRFYFPKLFDFITFGLGGFVDVGAVLDDVRGRDLLDRFRPSAGGELIVKYLELVIFRVDVAASNEGVLSYVEGRHMF